MNYNNFNQDINKVDFELNREGNYAIQNGSIIRIGKPLNKDNNLQIVKMPRSPILLNLKIIRIFGFPYIDMMHSIYHNVAISNAVTILNNNVKNKSYTLQNELSIYDIMFVHELQNFFRENLNHEFNDPEIIKKLGRLSIDQS